jgi:glycerol-3-phosphate acyltransferase PlsY
VGVSRRVSVGSLIAAAGLPAVLAALGRPRRDLALAILLAVLVVLWHRGNLRRLLRGQEPVVGQRGGEDR